MGYRNPERKLGVGGGGGGGGGGSFLEVIKNSYSKKQ